MAPREAPVGIPSWSTRDSSSSSSASSRRSTVATPAVAPAGIVTEVERAV